MYSNELIFKSQSENEQKDLSSSYIPDISLTQKLESYEQTIDQLRHEISRLSSKNKLETTPNENFSYKYYSLSTELSRCLQSSGCELSKFASSYDQAIKSLRAFGSGFSSIITKMRSKLGSQSKSLLNFMHSIMDELQDLRAQVTIIQNYIAVLEFNEASLRESLNKLEKRNQMTRSVSVSRMEQLSRCDTLKNGLVFDFAPRFASEDIRDKLNKLVLRNCKMKNLKVRAEIDNERLLLQLKQAKEQIAISEEEAANRELALEIRCQKMTEVLQRLKNIPSLRQLVLGFEAEIQRSKKLHSRTKSGISLYYNYDHEIKVLSSCLVRECKILISEIFQISSSFFRLHSRVNSIEVILSDSFPLNFYFPDCDFVIVSIQEINILKSFTFCDLLKAIKSNNIENFESCLLSIDNPYSIQIPGQNKLLTLAHVAVIESSDLVLDKILSINTDLINQETTDGKTPLMLASSCGSLNCVKVLFKFKELIKDQVSKKGSALHYAVKAEQVEIVDYLCLNGCSTLIQDSSGKNPIEYTNNKLILESLSKSQGSQEIFNQVKQKEPIYAVKVNIMSSGLFSDQEVFLVLNTSQGRIEEYSNDQDYLNKKPPQMIFNLSQDLIVEKYLEGKKKKRFFIKLANDHQTKVYYSKFQESRDDLIQNILERKKSCEHHPSRAEIFEVSDNNHLVAAKSLNLQLLPEDFTRICEIGEGSFGKVYKVTQKITNEVYAMKCLSKVHLARRRMLEYAEREIEIMKNLDHPFILKMVLSISLDSRFYLLLEFCENGDLEEALSHCSLNDIEAKFILAEVLLGLEYLHGQLIIYRDLKLENILIDSEGHVRLADFGLSRRVEDEKNVLSTVVGSPAYMSPEILKRKPVSFASDVYSYGVVMHQVLTGELPFESLQIDKVFDSVKSGRHSFSKKLRKDDLQLIKKLMSFKPDDRPTLQQVKNHKFFKGINWETLLLKRYKPPKTNFR